MIFVIVLFLQAVMRQVKERFMQRHIRASEDKEKQDDQEGFGSAAQIASLESE